jgi:tetratricopeptide (TPR) repeat protein
LRRIVELEPEFAGAQQCLEAAYTYQGMYDAAVQYARQSLMRSGTDLAQIAGADQKDPKSVLEATWRWQLKKLEQSTGVPQDYRIASYHALLGEREQALAWLNRAFEDRDPSLVAVHVDSAFESIRLDPRFNDLLRRIGLM